MSIPSDFVPPLPPGWERTQLRRVVTINNGRDYKDVEVSEGGYPVYGSGGEFRRASDFLFDGESILFGRKGTIDKPLYVNGKFWTVDTMFYAIPNERSCAKFIYYFATTIPYDYYVTSTALPSMTQGDLAGHAVALPPLAEQVAIADYLDRETQRIDELIAEQRGLIETLRERRVSVITESVFGQANQVVPLRRAADAIDCAHVTADFVDDDRRYPVASIAECQGDYVDLSTAKYTTADFFDHLRSGSRTPREGDLLFIRNASVGSVAAIAPDTPAFAVGQETVLLRRKSAILADFLRFTLNSARVKHDIDRAMIGSTFKRINVTAIRSLPVPLPSLRDQEMIAAYLDDQTSRIDALITESEDLISLSLERRAALITAAVTGQIDVRTAA